MKYPMINKQPKREFNVPKLSGGLNLRDSLTGVHDNQLTECVNMWYKEGLLRTRPNFITNYNMINVLDNIKSNDKITTYFHNEIKLVYKGFECICVSNKRISIDENTNISKCTIEFEFQSSDRIFLLPKISDIVADNEITYFLCEMNGILYCYVSDFSVWKLCYSENDVDDNSNVVWEKVEFAERYIPKVYIHCMRSGFDDFESTLFEGYNLIGDRYKMIYSAYNENDSDTTHPMRYSLGQDLAKSGEIKVEVTAYDTVNEKPIVVEHSIKYSENDYKNFKNGKILIEKTVNDETPKDDLFLFVKKNYVGFLSDSNSESSIVTIDSDERRKKYGNVEDNIVITVPYETSESDLKKVFCMSQTIWFGGTANGINGGSRLFLGGNTETNEKSLVLWSSLNDPLFFSENNYAYVGSKSCSVTAFGRQNENLIIFKENKIYYTYYANNSEITADDLINKAVIDYEANSVYFPIIQLNGFIGCDCPDTVQMCRNRLVWANSVGRIYTLCTVSQYNERTVYEISDMIAPKLKKYKERLKNATSADFDGHYILFLDDCAFVADYNCYGYQYIYSYSKDDDANAMIPWYYWEFPFLNADRENDVYKNAHVCILGDTLLMRAYFKSSVNNKSAFVAFSMNENAFLSKDIYFCNDFNNSKLQLCETLISSLLNSKLFELGKGIYTFTVDAAYIKVGSNNASDIIVKFLSEQGEESVIVTSNKEFIDVATKNFIKPKKVTPCVKSILKFGIQLKCEGLLAVDGIYFKYRLLGGSK